MDLEQLDTTLPAHLHSVPKRLAELATTNEALIRVFGAGDKKQRLYVAQSLQSVQCAAELGDD